METDANIKLKKIENDLRKAQTVAEHSIKELNDKNRMLANSKVRPLLDVIPVVFRRSFFE